MSIKDSGKRREFSTGAVRDVQEGKGRCDLLPLYEVGELLHSTVLKEIARFMHSREERFLYGAIIDFVNEDGSGFENFKLEEVMLEVAKHFEEGASKYEERNWEKGIPLHNYIDSGVRHYLKARAGWDDEPHNRAFVWNMLCCIWTLRNHPKLDDLPKVENEEMIE